MNNIDSQPKVLTLLEKVSEKERYNYLFYLFFQLNTLVLFLEDNSPLYKFEEELLVQYIKEIMECSKFDWANDKIQKTLLSAYVQMRFLQKSIEEGKLKSEDVKKYIDELNLELCALLKQDKNNNKKDAI